MQIAICLLALLATFQSTDAAAVPDSGYFSCLFAGCQNGQVCDPALTTQCKETITGDNTGACAATYYNYNCGSSTAAITGTECDGVPCVAANTHDCGAATSGPCVCKAGYYNIVGGDQTCATPRAHAICKNTGMDIIFAPHEGDQFVAYGGKVVQVNPANSLLIPACALAADATAQEGGAVRYSILNLPYVTPATGDCLLPDLVPGTSPDPDKYTTTWYIQYGNTLGANNVKFTVECQKPTDPLVEIAAQISVILETPTEVTAALQETVTAGVEWRIAQLSDLTTAVPDPIPKDIIHALVIDMAVSTSPASLYDDHILLRLTGYNWDISKLATAGSPDTTNNLDFSSEEFINDACALKTAAGVLRGMRKVNVAAASPDPAYVRTIVDFIGFNFPTQAPGYDATIASPTVAVGTTWLQITLCLGCPVGTRPLPVEGSATTPLAVGVICGGTGAEIYIPTDTSVFTDLTAAPTGRRRRRQVEGSIPQEMVASNMSVVFVGFDNSGPARTIIATPGQDTTTDCHQTMSFLIPIILLSALLLVAVAMAAFFCLKVSRSQGHPEGHTNMAYK